MNDKQKIKHYKKAIEDIENILKNAPEEKDGMFVVPRTFE